MIFRLIVALRIVAIAACVIRVWSSAPIFAAESITFLRNVHVIDGSGNPPLEQADVLIRGDRIASVAAASPAPPPAGATVLDLSGKTLMPGLISAHSHVGLVDGTTVSAGNYNRANIERQLRQYQAYGVTTIASLGLNGPLFFDLRGEGKTKPSSGADLLGAGPGVGVPNGAPPAAAVPVAADQIARPETPEQAREAVAAAARLGADLIKLWLDDFRGSVPVKMKPEIYAAVIDEAHKHGLRAAAHVYYLEDAKGLLRAGVDVLAHGVRDQAVDQELIELLNERETWYIATIGVDESAYMYADEPTWMREPFFQHALQPEVAAQFASAEWREGVLANRALVKAREAVEVNKQNLAALHRAGVKIAFGADSGANALRIPGFAEHRELQLMVEAGLTPLEALRAATSSSAALLKLDDRGAIAPGKLADFVVLSANPAHDISATQRIEAVWRRGAQVAGAVTEFTP
jgi:imidazolonepropionase-like amidohydrolase